MRKSKASKGTTLHDLTLLQSPRDQRLFLWLTDYLHRNYDRSGRVYTVAHPNLNDCTARAPSVESDGEAGAALLTEIQHWLGNEDITSRREYWKKMIIWALRKAKLFTIASPDPLIGNFHYVRLKPRRKKPIGERLLYLTMLMRLPEGVVDIVLNYSTWYSHQKLKALPRLNGSKSITTIDLTTVSPPLRRLLREALCYPTYTCCQVCFTHAEPMEAEWCKKGRYIWLMASSLWPLIEVLRYLRDQRGGNAELLHLRGYGPVLI